jgi:hypothetical protein
MGIGTILSSYFDFSFLPAGCRTAIPIHLCGDWMNFGEVSPGLCHQALRPRRAVVIGAKYHSVFYRHHFALDLLAGRCPPFDCAEDDSIRGIAALISQLTSCSTVGYR